GEQNRRTGSIEAGGEAGGGEGHEGDETVDLGFAGEQPGSDASEAEGVESKLGTHPVRAGRGDVAFGEHEVEGPEDSAEAVGRCAVGWWGRAGGMRGRSVPSSDRRRRAGSVPAAPRG